MASCLATDAVTDASELVDTAVSMNLPCGANVERAKSVPSSPSQLQTMVNSTLIEDDFTCVCYAYVSVLRRGHSSVSGLSLSVGFCF